MLWHLGGILAMDFFEARTELGLGVCSFSFHSRGPGKSFPPNNEAHWCCNQYLDIVLCLWFDVTVLYKHPIAPVWLTTERFLMSQCHVAHSLGKYVAKKWRDCCTLHGIQILDLLAHPNPDGNGCPCYGRSPVGFAASFRPSGNRSDE